MSDDSAPIQARIDPICDAFETAWKKSVERSGSDLPNMVEFISQATEGDRPQLVFELVLLDIHYRQLSGKEWDKANYHEQLADFPEQVDRAFAQSDPDATIPPIQAAEEETLAPGEAEASLEPGEVVKYFGDYEIIDEIARGGMGVVYRAKQISLNRTIALKMILSGQLAGEADVRRFQIEAEAAANLDHPGIVPIYDIGEHSGQHYFTMKLVEGSTLSEKGAALQQNPAEAIELVAKVADAMHHAHQRGILHRDLKPGNILLDADDQPMITDFGLARDTQQDSGLTQTGAIVGTPGFMPPEQAAGKSVTTAADI